MAKTLFKVLRQEGIVFFYFRDKRKYNIRYKLSVYPAQIQKALRIIEQSNPDVHLYRQHQGRGIGIEYIVWHE